VLAAAWKPEPLARGVYWAPTTKNGKPQCLAVDSHGDEIERLVVEDASWNRCEAAVRHLWNYLNVADPIASAPVIDIRTTLQLVR
jgi:hypothetical protein